MNISRDIKNNMVQEIKKYSHADASTDIPLIYNILNSDIESTKNEIEEKKNILKKESNQLALLNDKYKTIQDTYNKIFKNGLHSVSLIYKKQNNIHYLKARCYWDKSQREVQIGTINKTINFLSAVSDTFKKYISNKNLGDITWDMIKKDNYINEEIKKYARIKLKLYILNKLTPQYKKPEENNILKKKISKLKNKESSINRVNKVNIEVDGEPGSDLQSNWYNSWKNRTS